MQPIIGITAAWTAETWGDCAGKDYFYVGSSYAQAIYVCGGLPVLLPPLTAQADEVADKTIARALLDMLDGLVLSGGGDARSYKLAELPGLEIQQPVRYRFEALLVREAWRRRLPVLGICRGHQMLVEALGGKMREQPVEGHSNDMSVSVNHAVYITPGTLLAELVYNPKWYVNSFHCQVAESLPPGFVVSARSEDGCIEAVESSECVTDFFFMGVQFHPELLLDHDENARRLWHLFISSATNSRK